MTVADQAGARTVLRDDPGSWARKIVGRTIENMRATSAMEVHAPAGSDDAGGIVESRHFESVLDEIRAFRARVLYASGRRPSFRTADGGFTDPEDADGCSYHILCRDQQGALIGYLRLGPADLLPSSSVEAHLGAERAERVVTELGLDRTRIFEAGRLVVDEDRRKQGVAVATVLLALALARRLGRPVTWATAGERDGQHRFFSRFGSDVLPGSSVYMPKYDDDVCVVVHDQRVIPARIREAIDLVEQVVLGTDDLSEVMEVA